MLEEKYAWIVYNLILVQRLFWKKEREKAFYAKNCDKNHIERLEICVHFLRKHIYEIFFIAVVQI